MKDAFSGFHPFINLLFFSLTLAFAMTLTHPACLAASLACSLAYSIYLNRGKAIRFSLVFLLPMLLVTALLNPLFNHRGVTILTYLWNGNPLTLESIAYGAVSAVILISSISWFSCVNAVMTGDKLIYLFGRVIPSFSLVLSMSLRLAPRFKAQAKVISGAMKGAGLGVANGGPLRRIRNGVGIISILVTWALENAVETADSMKSRGYGLPGRTAFSIYRFDRRDLAALCFLLFCGGYVVLGAFTGGLYYRYFPSIKGGPGGPWPISVRIVYFTMCFSPIAFNLWEDRKWKALESRA